MAITMSNKHLNHGKRIFMKKKSSTILYYIQIRPMKLLFSKLDKEINNSLIKELIDQFA